MHLTNGEPQEKITFLTFLLSNMERVLHAARIRRLGKMPAAKHKRSPYVRLV